MSLIPFFGDGHLLWASDYPHPDSVWPNSVSDRATDEGPVAGYAPQVDPRQCGRALRAERSVGHGLVELDVDVEVSGR